MLNNFFLPAMGGYQTRIMLRFVTQEENGHGFLTYEKFWSQYVEPLRGDAIMKMEPHNWAGKIETTFKKKIYSCRFIDDDWITINAFGNMEICCMDINKTILIGNVFNNNAIELFNSQIYNNIRSLSIKKALYELPLCAKCTYEESREFTVLPDQPKN